ncbi:tetratricopeptide repeat protein [Lutibacter sp.]
MLFFIIFGTIVSKINVTLYPNSSNVYNSLAEAFMKSDDMLQVIANYKKSLTLDFNNLRVEKYIKKLSHHMK